MLLECYNSGNFIHLLQINYESAVPRSELLKLLTRVSLANTGCNCTAKELPIPTPSSTTAFPFSHFCYLNSDTPEAAYIRCTGDTARGWCVLHHLLFLLPLLCSSLQPIHTHYDGDSPPGRHSCSPSIAKASFVPLSLFSWGFAPMAGWTLGCYGSSWR